MAREWRKRGFQRLWRIVAGASADEIDNQRPIVANAVRAVSRSGLSDVDRVSRAQEITDAYKLPLPHKSAIEAGAAYALSVVKLRRVATRSASLAAQPHGQRDTDEMDLVLDSWWTYLQRYIEATSKFARLAAKELGARDRTADLKQDLDVWAKDRKRTLGPGRNEVAHANTTWIVAINEDRLWQPMLLLGLATPELLEEILSGQSDNGSEYFFARWDQALQQAATLALQQGDSWLKPMQPNSGEPDL